MTRGTADLWVQRGWARWVGRDERGMDVLEVYGSRPLHRYANPRRSDNEIVSLGGPSRVYLQPVTS